MIEIVQKQVTVPVYVHVVKTELPKTQEPYWGNLANAEFSIPANQYNANIAGKNARWIVLPDLGRDEACMGIQPVTAPSADRRAPCLEYKVFLPKVGKTTVC